MLKSVKISISDLEDTISDPAFMWIFEGRYRLAECSTFFYCVFSCVSSNCLPERMQSHIGCISLALLRCASSNCLHERTHSHTDCICLSFLHCVFSNVFSNCLHEMMHTHTDCKYLTSLHCVLSYMFPQIVCPRRCKVALVALM